jgi:hypothetical protein
VSSVRFVARKMKKPFFFYHIIYNENSDEPIRPLARGKNNFGIIFSYDPT